MRIGIMTLWGTEFNYGAVLQCYAMQEYLRKNGHDPYLIRYKNVNRGRNLKKISIKKILKYVYKKIQENKQKKIKDEPRFFSVFIDKYIEQTDRDYNGYKDLKDEPPKADMYIVGSDQVWNFYETPIDVCRNHIHAYFLDFGNSDVLRASYAASWDKQYVTDEQLKEIKQLIKNFDYVSVREKNGLELCYECGRNDAEWVVDPTMLLQVSDYRKIYEDKANNVRKIDEDYILIYMVLSQKHIFDLSYVYEFAREKSLKVIYVAEDKTNDSYEKYYPSIPEWLYLIDNAKYVVTNSFHGTVFSLLFHKQFGTIPLAGVLEATNARIISLSQFFNTPTRFIKNRDLTILDTEYVTQFKMTENSFLKFINQKQ